MVDVWFPVTLFLKHKLFSADQAKIMQFGAVADIYVAK